METGFIFKRIGVICAGEDLLPLNWDEIFRVVSTKIAL